MKIKLFVINYYLYDSSNSCSYCCYDNYSDFHHYLFYDDDDDDYC